MVNEFEMATETPNKINGYFFQWKIENISHCWKKKGESIESPSFTADALKGTKWSLQLYPMGKYYDTEIVVHLHRAKDCSEPNSIEVSYKLNLLDKDGKLLTEKATLNYEFSHDFVHSGETFARENVFSTEREVFLPEDTLTVQCILWKKETFVKSKHIFARTVFKVNRRSFLWKINGFSTLLPGVRYEFKDDFMHFDIVLIDGLDFEKKLVMESILFDECLKYFAFKFSIIDSEGRKEEYGRHEYFAGDLRTGLLCTLLFTKRLIENKSRYLPNDALSLDCEYFYSTGTSLYQFYGCELIPPKVMKAAIREKNGHLVEQNTRQATDLVNDFKSMYNDGIISDTALRTSTETFKAHKAVLSARSPVFRRMFSHDMMERNSGYVDIDDLEDDTVHRMLLYLYTDSLENLQLDNACKLYAAAEKYEILPLRNRCSSFLKDNLIASKACDILVLADLHQDDDLKSAVQDLILGHDKEVFGSQEWKLLMARNLQLAADVMFRKVCPD